MVLSICLGYLQVFSASSILCCWGLGKQEIIDLEGFSKILRILRPFMFMTLTVGTTDFGLSPLCKGKREGCEIRLHFVQVLSSSGAVDAVT